MSSIQYSKARDRDFIKAGDLRTRIKVYDPKPTSPAAAVDEEGSVIRLPSGGGAPVGTGALPQTALWLDRASFYNFGSQGRPDGDREISELWSTVTVRFQEKKPYKAGYVIQNLETGAVSVVVGEPNNVDEGFVKTILTCRRVV